MKILLAEDDACVARVVERVLIDHGYDVVAVSDGLQALEKLEKANFDAVITDWMMPKMDGIELIRRIREQMSHPPLILVVTAISYSQAREHALDAGADAYLSKPFTSHELVTSLERCLNQLHQPLPRVQRLGRRVRMLSRTPPFVAVCIGASTGGPQALDQIVTSLTPSPQAAYFLAQHGPPWMLDSLIGRLQARTELLVEMAHDGVTPEAGRFYVAPGDKHLVFDEQFRLRLDVGPPENYVRPSADPMFRSAAETFGPHVVAVILTGLGRDGCRGAQQVTDVGGTVIVQDPSDCVAPFMPDSVIATGIPCEARGLDKLASAIEQAVGRHEVPRASDSLRSRV